MKSRTIFALCMALAGVIASALGIMLLGLPTGRLFAIVLPAAALSGAVVGWYIPHWIFRAFGRNWIWAGIAGLSCAFVGLLVGPVVYIVAVSALDGTLFRHPGDVGTAVVIGSIYVHVACGFFGYPLAAIATILAHALTAETQRAAGEHPPQDTLQ